MITIIIHADALEDIYIIITIKKMDLYTAYQIEQHIQNAGNLTLTNYLHQLSGIEEKFRIWKNKDILERATIFKKVATLSRNHGDSLSEWVVSEMGILLENSEVG